jgi:pyridoxine kinase
MRILSIQSSVAYGYVGNSAATFPLQRLGHEVWPVLTVHFSNHTGYGSWRGAVLDPAVVGEVVAGIADRGVLGTADAVLTGYQGSPGVSEVVLDAVAQVRALNPAAVYCCDPVMGDVGRGFFVAPGIPELIRDRVVPVADIVTPNAFELAFLAGVPGTGDRTGGGFDAAAGTAPVFDPAGYDPPPFDSAVAVVAAAETVRARGPRTVLVTSVEYPGLAGRIGMIAVGAEGAFEVSTPRLPLSVNGAGDVTAALFLAHLSTAGIEAALARTASTVYAILAETDRVGAREIRLVDAQQAIAEPACEFEVRRIG